jgi:hypothetical protein
MQDSRAILARQRLYTYLAADWFDIHLLLVLRRYKELPDHLQA